MFMHRFIRIFIHKPTCTFRRDGSSCCAAVLSSISRHSAVHGWACAHVCMNAIAPAALRPNFVQQSTRMPARMSVHSSAHSPVHLSARMPTCMSKRIHACLHTRLRTRLHTRLHTCPGNSLPSQHTCLYTLLRICRDLYRISAHKSACMLAHVPALMSTHMPTHMPTLACVEDAKLLPKPVTGIQKCVRAFMSAWVRGCGRASVRSRGVCMRASVRWCVRACVSVCVRACERACVHPSLGICISACMRLCVPPCVHVSVLWGAVPWRRHAHTRACM